jgi:hypothetical protein
VPLLFLTSSLAIVFGSYPGFDDYANLPSGADFEEVFELTSWIDNETVQDKIFYYLLLCPEQDMCLGEKFKRTYFFTLPPACSMCECDDSCVRRATCCPSKFYRQIPAPHFIKYQNTSDDNQGPPQHCLDPLWNMDSIVKSGQPYWMIKTCPDGAICISTPSRNITNSTPVTSLITKETYISIECALCNEEEPSHLVLWEKKKVCTRRFAVLSRENPEKLFKSVFKQEPVCNVGFNPPASVQSVANRCIAYTQSGNCESTSENRTNNFLVKACHQYYLPYHAYDMVYKNIYCALCDYQAKDLYIQYDSNSGGIYVDSMLSSFSALMDSDIVEKEPIANTMKCKGNQIFDEKLVGPVIPYMYIILYLVIKRINRVEQDTEY